MMLFPNAKINLGLNVTAKRFDGYHNIETIFIPVSLCDILEFVESSDTKISITGADLEGKPEENLVVKAWQLMNQHYQVSPVDIHLHKMIPVGAGLGGGSSDAAFMLKGLNEFFKCGAQTRDLEKLASKLGSDCAFFIRNIPSFGTGRGEILKPISIHLEGFQLLLINPSIHVSTRDAYSGVKPSLPKKLLEDIITQNPDSWQQLIANDFEESVFFKYPEIARIKEKLISAGAIYASMSGSGSTVYGIFDIDLKIQNLISEFTGYFIWNGKLSGK
jgi:4-diphosphocytidyl-2-C-methyl-D-erythritol kinase